MSEITMTQGNLMERKKQHTVQEDCHLKSRDKSDKFDLATDVGYIDFNISGIPDEAVKRSQNFNILQLIRRITSHPQQEAVQNDLEKTTIIQCIHQRVEGCHHGCRKHGDFRDCQRGAEVAMQGVS